MLTKEQIETYQRDGYLKVDSLFTPEESAELASEMVRIIEQWGQETIGWHGPWRDRYLPEEERQNTKAVFLHNPHHYSAAWGRVIFHEAMLHCINQLLDGRSNGTTLCCTPSRLQWAPHSPCTRTTRSTRTTAPILSTVCCT